MDAVLQIDHCGRLGEHLGGQPDQQQGHKAPGGGRNVYQIAGLAVLFGGQQLGRLGFKGGDIFIIKGVAGEGQLLLILSGRGGDGVLRPGLLQGLLRGGPEVQPLQAQVSPVEAGSEGIEGLEKLKADGGDPGVG